MIKVASVQTNPVINAVEDNVTDMVRAIEDLAGAGVQLAVFPELATTGYMFDSPAEARAVAEEVPNGPTVQRLLRACADNDMYVVFGIAELAGDDIYNSSAILGPDGHIGTYRKLHLWDNENTMFTPGDLGLPVFSTPLGNIGILICYDIWFPEAVRALTLSGADLLCVPTNWVPLVAGNGANDTAMANVLCMANSHCNGLPIVAADRCGEERGQLFLGRSVITNATGWPAAGPGHADREDVLIADVDVESSASSRQWGQFNNPLTNRRPDVYQ
ncbi:nitrilase family protein [Mycobacterium yunnanensis]|uniref:nitrilase family protein n=1 Tax=Mycobacterium yunnanensis TaxID=368477 RepID=UPI0021F282B7|nr:nitrilase family protein [Mycobacterium yunnanensis]